jgi:hypothetical protein
MEIEFIRIVSSTPKMGGQTNGTLANGSPYNISPSSFTIN